MTVCRPKRMKTNAAQSISHGRSCSGESDQNDASMDAPIKVPAMSVPKHPPPDEHLVHNAGKRLAAGTHRDTPVSEMN